MKDVGIEKQNKGKYKDQQRWEGSRLSEMTYVGLCLVLREMSQIYSNHWMATIPGKNL